MKKKARHPSGKIIEFDESLMKRSMNTDVTKKSIFQLRHLLIDSFLNSMQIL
jgi:hypothetical protein